MKWIHENSSSPLRGVSSLNPVITITPSPHPTFTMGGLGDTTLKNPSKYGTISEDEICRNEADGSKYSCAVGHCCAEAKCCTYYYELWWFWLIWTLIILMSCCCAYHHRKKRQSLRAQRSRNGGNEPYAGTCNYPGPPVDKGMLGYCKLPKYEDIARIPPSGSPPPPYQSRRALNSIAHLDTDSEGVTIMNFLSYHDLTSSALSLVSSFGFTFRQRDEDEERHCRQIRHQNNHCQRTEEGNDVTINDTDSRTNIPPYSGNDELDSFVLDSYPEEKKSIHVIDCQTSDLTKRDLNDEPPDPDGLSIADDYASIPGNEENYVKSEPRDAVSVIDEKSSKRERQRQDSGIGADEVVNELSSSTESLNQDAVADPADDEFSSAAYENLRVKKEVSLVKQYEKCRPHIPNLSRFANLSQDEDSSSSDDDMDDQMTFLPDLNNNGTSTSRYSPVFYGDCPYPGPDNSGRDDFVLELSPIMPENSSGEASHSTFST